jgi:hypothetical protein
MKLLIVYEILGSHNSEEVDVLNLCSSLRVSGLFNSAVK